MSLLAVILVLASLAGGVTRTAPGQGTIEAWAARTRPVTDQLPVRLPTTPMPETLVTLSAPRIFPLVPGNRYSETRVPVGYDTALTEWDLLVREMTGTPSLSEQARTARYPSGMPVSLAAPADCACGHSEFAHQHYRPGADCSLCGCQAYRPVLP